MGVSLVIPALNEAACLGPLLAEVPPGLVDQIIVVDNGSTDDTAEVALSAGADVVYEPRRGYGFACAAGAAGACEELLVFMDGDGSFIPAELPRLVAPLMADEACLVLGSRFLNGAPRLSMPPHQRFGNRLFTWLLSRRFGLVLTDLGPYRAVRRGWLHALDMQEHTYGWPLEMVIKTARRRQALVEVPVTYRPRIAGRSKVSGTLRGSILTAYRYSRVTLRYAW